MIGYIYYYCDEWHSYNSMRSLGVVYKNTVTGRRKLARKIISEFENGNIEVNNNDTERICEIILSGEDVESINSLITYGCVSVVEIV